MSYHKLIFDPNNTIKPVNGELDNNRNLKHHSHLCAKCRKGDHCENID
jgi:hypothetical protein